MSSLSARRAARRPARLPAVAIHFACNDPDNGNWARAVSGINLMARGEIALDLVARNWRVTTFRGCPAFRDDGDGAIHLSGRRWPVLQSRQWVGNWCWNGYWFNDQVARQFLVWLHGTGKFNCEGGFVEIADAWDAAAPLPLFPDRPIGRGLWDTLKAPPSV